MADESGWVYRKRIVLSQMRGETEIREGVAAGSLRRKRVRSRQEDRNLFHLRKPKISPDQECIRARKGRRKINTTKNFDVETMLFVTRQGREPGGRERGSD